MEMVNGLAVIGGSWVVSWRDVEAIGGGEAFAMGRVVDVHIQMDRLSEAVGRLSKCPCARISCCYVGCIWQTFNNHAFDREEAAGSVE